MIGVLLSSVGILPRSRLFEPRSNAALTARGRASVPHAVSGAFSLLFPSPGSTLKSGFRTSTTIKLSPADSTKAARSAGSITPGLRPMVTTEVRKAAARGAIGARTIARLRMVSASIQSSQCKADGALDAARPRRSPVARLRELRHGSSRAAKHGLTACRTFRIFCGDYPPI